MLSSTQFHLAGRAGEVAHGRARLVFVIGFGGGVDQRVQRVFDHVMDLAPFTRVLQTTAADQRLHGLVAGGHRRRGHFGDISSKVKNSGTTLDTHCCPFNGV